MGKKKPQKKTQAAKPAEEPKPSPQEEPKKEEVKKEAPKPVVREDDGDDLDDFMDLAGSFKEKFEEPEKVVKEEHKVVGAKKQEKAKPKPAPVEDDDDLDDFMDIAGSFKEKNEEDAKTKTEEVTLAPPAKKAEKTKGGKQAEAPKEQKPAKGAGKPQKGGASGEVDSIESQLATSLWLGGHQPSSADREAFEGMGSAPNPETHPASFSWWLLVSKFAPAVRDAWAAGGDAGKGKADGGKAKEGKGKGGKKEKAAPKEEEDEMDLFGDDDEEDAAAKAELAAKAKDAGKKKKAPPVAKSLIIWDIKPWGPETDLDMLGKKIIEEIKMDGLMWKTEFKKEPVAFGVFKIVIGAVVEDAIVSTDLVQEKIEEMEEYV